MMLKVQAKMTESLTGVKRQQLGFSQDALVQGEGKVLTFSTSPAPRPVSPADYRGLPSFIVRAECSTVL